MKKLVSKLVYLIPFFVSVAFGLLVVFGLVGSIASPQSVLPAAFLVLAVLGWAATRMIREGINSAKHIHEVLTADDEEVADSDDADDSDGE